AVGTEPSPTVTVEDRLDGTESDSRQARIRADKRVASRRLRGWGYEFRYPTFREGYADGVAEYRRTKG
ncbi:NAD(P)-dependent oxidoreductase, partial [Halobacteriales archaeon SW_7_68_16]